MLKALVIATNSATLKHNNYFKALNVDISYFILEPHFKFVFPELETMKVYSQQMMLSVLPEAGEVNAHSEQRKKISSILFELKKQLCPDPVTHLKIKPLAANFHLMNAEVHLLKELKPGDFSNYQHIFIENSDSVLNYLEKECKSIFNVQKNKSAADIVFQWMAFHYQSESDLTLENSFLFCEDQNNVSVYDNCYFVEPQNKNLTIWTQVPLSLCHDDPFIRYFSDRIKQRLLSELIFLKKDHLQFKELGVDQVAISVATSHQLKATVNTTLFSPLNLYSEVERSLIFTQINADLYKKHKKYFKMKNELQNSLMAGH